MTLIQLETQKSNRCEAAAREHAKLILTNVILVVIKTVYTTKTGYVLRRVILRESSRKYSPQEELRR